MSKTGGKKKDTVERYKKGEISLRQAAKEEEKDLHEMIAVFEARGCFSAQGFDDALGFEKRQFDYIIGKIVNAIAERIGMERLKKAAEDLKADKLDLRQAAVGLGLDMTDLALVFEHRGLMTADEIKHELKQVVHKRREEFFERKRRQEKVAE
ncbi:MAG: hypothetical protein ABH829_00490 [archaeon]